MGLVTSKEIAESIKADKFGFLGTFLGWILMQLLRITTINKIYNRNKEKKDLQFLNSLMDEFQITFEIPKEDLKRIPKEGSFITISNHPLGGVDGILLLKLLIEHRPDFKIIANFLLHRIAPLKPYVMPVNPFENHKDAKSSIAGIKKRFAPSAKRSSFGNFPSGRSVHLQRW